jgi:uncharacterized protein (TIGR02099 family)
MLKASVRHLSWWSLMLAMVLGLVLLGLRVGLPRVADYRSDIALWLGARLGVELELGRLEAGWTGYYPTLVAGDIRVLSAADSGPRVALQVQRLDLQLDPWRSLLRWQPVFQQLHLSGVRGRWQQRDGRWLHRPGVGQGSSGLTANGWQTLLALALSQPEVRVSDAMLELAPEQGAVRTLRGIHALLENLDQQHQLSGELRVEELGEDTRLAFAVQFEGVPTDPLHGEFPFYLKLDSLGPELFHLVDVELPLTQLRAGTEFWGQWRDGRLTSLQGRLAVGALEYGEAAQQVSLNNSHLDFALLPKQQGYQLQLNDIVLNTADSRLELAQLLLEGRWRDGRVVPERIAVPQLELAPLTQWLSGQPLLPESIRTTLVALAPQGQLANLTLAWPETGDWQRAQLRADAHRLGVEAYFGAPQIRGASGLIEASLQGGTLHLQSDDFSLHFPKLYRDGWQFTRADGRIHWQLRPGAALINSELLHLGDDSVSAAGRFSIDIPYAREQQTELTLLIGMTDSDGRQAQRFTPPREVGEALHHWLGQAIEGGQVRQAGFLLHGGTRRLASRQPPSVQLFFDIGQARLNYDPAWPVVSDADLFLYIRNGDLRVDLRQGRVMDSDIRGGWAYKPLHQDALQVVAQLQGPAQDVPALLRSEPLNQSVGQALGDWQLEGQLEALLELSIPVRGDARTPMVSVDARLSDGVMGSAALGLQIEALNGPLRYGSATGLAGGPLQGRLLDHPLQGSIATDEGVTRIALGGRAPLAALKQWLALDALRPVTGELPYEARLQLCNGRADCQSRFGLHSDLAGTAVDLPGGYGLAADQQGALQLTLALDSRQLDFSYLNRLHGRFDLAASDSRGTLRFGAGTPSLYDGNGLRIEGALPVLDVSDLVALQARFSVQSDVQGQSGASATDALGGLRQLDLEIGELHAGALRTGPLTARLEPAAQGWLLQLDGEQVQGEVRMPTAQPVAVALSRLTLRKAEAVATEPQEERAQDDAEWTRFDTLPEIDLNIGELIWDGRALGRWQAQLRPDGDHLRIRGIEAIMGQLALRGELSWLQGSNPHTGLTLKVQGEDIGEQLVQWQLDKVLESEQLDASLQLEWPGAPWQLKASGLDGAVQFTLKDGRLIESGNSANLLRVFGILNFNTLGRRLRLDFSDLFKKGVAFDRLQGDYRIDNGVAHTVEPLQMQGPSANLQARGSLNFSDETVDKEMEVVLPLTSNVPFAAVLLGAPQVAGAVFLIDKLIGDKLERVTTLRYRVSGDWGDPQVELQTQPPQPAGQP